jgi:hypothetical protein
MNLVPGICHHISFLVSFGFWVSSMILNDTLNNIVVLSGVALVFLMGLLANADLVALLFLLRHLYKTSAIYFPKTRLHPLCRTPSHPFRRIG